MALVRRLTFLVAVAFLAFAPVAAALGFNGLWVLDLKASQDVLDSQKGVDLKISLRGNELTILREVAGKTIGTRQLFLIDGRTRQMEVAGGQVAQVETKWLVPGTKLQQTIRISIAGSPVPAVQTTVMELSADGQTLTRVQSLDQTGDATERKMVYRRR